MTIETLDDTVKNEILPRLMELRRYFHPEFLEAEDAAETEARERDERKQREG